MRVFTIIALTGILNAYMSSGTPLDETKEKNPPIPEELFDKIEPKENPQKVQKQENLKTSFKLKEDIEISDKDIQKPEKIKQKFSDDMQRSEMVSTKTTSQKTKVTDQDVVQKQQNITDHVDIDDPKPNARDDDDVRISHNRDYLEVDDKKAKYIRDPDDEQRPQNNKDRPNARDTDYVRKSQILEMILDNVREYFNVDVQKPKYARDPDDVHRPHYIRDRFNVDVQKSNDKDQEDVRRPLNIKYYLDADDQKPKYLRDQDDVQRPHKNGDYFVVDDQKLKYFRDPDDVHRPHYIRDRFNVDVQKSNDKDEEDVRRPHNIKYYLDVDDQTPTYLRDHDDVHRPHKNGDYFVVDDQKPKYVRYQDNIQIPPNIRYHTNVDVKKPNFRDQYYAYRSNVDIQKPERVAEDFFTYARKPINVHVQEPVTVRPTFNNIQIPEIIEDRFSGLQTPLNTKDILVDVQNPVYIKPVFNADIQIPEIVEDTFSDIHTYSHSKDIFVDVQKPNNVKYQFYNNVQRPGYFNYALPTNLEDHFYYSQELVDTSGASLYQPNTVYTYDHVYNLASPLIYFNSESSEIGEYDQQYPQTVWQLSHER